MGVEISLALAEVLGEARTGEPKVVALTGSGISAESGVPTFRDAQTGLWERYDPTELATPGAFERDPRLVYEWYSWRRKLVESVSPSPGHKALAELERRVGSFTLITQNVDGLHERAGSERVIELHGNLRRTKCSREGMVVDAGEETDEEPPSCPRCGAPLRPDVVWFGEMLPQDSLQAASEAASGCGVFLSVGTSGLVYPAASLPYEALGAGAMLVEINPEDTPLTPHADYALRGKAEEVLLVLVDAAFPA